MNEELGAVNPNLLYPLTKKEERTVGLVMRLTDLDRDHAIEFTRLFYWQISTSPGGADGFIRQKMPGLLRSRGSSQG